MREQPEAIDRAAMAAAGDELSHTSEGLAAAVEALVRPSLADMEGDKTYRFTVRWGQATDTDDSEGQVVAEDPKRPEKAEIEALLPRFEGEIEQVPPAYSAIKVAGQRAYDLAREGETVELKPRTVFIEWMELVDRPDEDHDRRRRNPLCLQGLDRRIRVRRSTEEAEGSR